MDDHDVVEQEEEEEIAVAWGRHKMQLVSKYDASTPSKRLEYSRQRCNSTSTTLGSSKQLFQSSLCTVRSPSSRTLEPRGYWDPNAVQGPREPPTAKATVSHFCWHLPFFFSVVLVTTLEVTRTWYLH